MTAAPSAPLSWHAAQWRQLASYRDKLPHALLLSGAAGLGKAEFAARLQRLLLCRHPAADSNGNRQPCAGANLCSSCRLIDSNTNPDLITSDTPPGKQIVLDDIEQLRGFLFTSSHLGGAKVALLLNADRMNLSAANSLLKILEEPPPRKFLILTTANKGLLLPTILSRCIRMQFAAPPSAETRAWLAAQLGDEHAELLKQELLFDLRSNAPYAIHADLVSGKAELSSKFIRQLEDSAGGGALPELAAYKDLETIELVDLMLWHSEQQSKKLLVQTHPAAAKQTGPPSAPQHQQQQLLGWRSLLLSHRAMLLRKLNPNRELLLQEAFFHLRAMRASRSTNHA